jgi:aryl-alcohol dehydrogenase-like predicted oxidoreductase
LQTGILDIVFLHSAGEDIALQQTTDAVATLRELKNQGLVRAIGLSGKTVEGAWMALDWADVLMVEYHLADRSHASVIAEAARRGVGVVVKKGLASGKLPATEAIGFVLGDSAVTSLVVGSLNLEHLRANVTLAAKSSSRSAGLARNL